jgi:hypothetical protein
MSGTVISPSPDGHCSRIVLVVNLGFGPCDANHGVNERLLIHHHPREATRGCFKQTSGMTIMNNIQAMLSDAELDTVVGGTLPKAIQAMEINRVEQEHLPTGMKNRLIREIEGLDGYAVTVSSSKSFQ